LPDLVSQARSWRASAVREPGKHAAVSKVRKGASDNGYQMKTAQGRVADQAPEERRPWRQRMPGWPRVAILVRVDA